MGLIVLVLLLMLLLLLVAVVAVMTLVHVVVVAFPGKRTVLFAVERVPFLTWTLSPESESPQFVMFLPFLQM